MRGLFCLPEGVQLLCLIDKAADACRYLQTYGEWNRAAWLAKVGIPSRCPEKWDRELSSFAVLMTACWSTSGWVVLAAAFTENTLHWQQSGEAADSCLLASDAARPTVCEKQQLSGDVPVRLFVSVKHSSLLCSVVVLLLPWEMTSVNQLSLILEYRKYVGLEIVMTNLICIKCSTPFIRLGYWQQIV